MTESYAQFGTDLAIAAMLPGPAGTYLDIGAHHPSVDSNTYLLYRRGWRGTTVEPNPALIALHRGVRPGDRQVEAAVGDREGTAGLHVCGVDSVSTLSPVEAHKRAAEGQVIRVLEVRLTTVAALTAGGPPPDVLSIDVEGYERQVLLGCPFAAGWLPRLIVLEATYPCTAVPSYDQWEGLLTAHDYAHARTCGINRIYTRPGGR